MTAKPMKKAFGYGAPAKKVVKQTTAQAVAASPNELKAALAKIDQAASLKKGK